MRISIFKLTAYYLYQVIATDASKEENKKANNNNNPNPENTDCNSNVAYVIDKNLSKKPAPFSSSDFRDWAKNHNLMILQESYTLVNPGKVAETPGSVLEGLDKAANAPGKADVENLYLPKPDFDYTEGYGPKSKESKNKKPDSKKGSPDDKKKSGDDSGEGDKDKDKTKDKGANDQKNPEQKGGANDQKSPEQKGANDQKQQPSQQQSGGAQKKRKNPDSSSSSSSDDDMKEVGPGGQNKKAKKSKLKAGFLSDDSFLKGSSWKSSFLKSNI